jgi:hypothetical protein
LRAEGRRDSETVAEKVESGGGVKASLGCSDENPQGLKTQEGIGLLAGIIPLLVVTDCCLD